MVCYCGTVYPFGTIAIYPSCKNSITNTFPHQSINAFEEENHLWRKGKLCVDLIDQTLGIRVPEKEPFTVDERLFWNMQRAVLWLRAAAEERLIKMGMPLSYQISSLSYTDSLCFSRGLCFHDDLGKYG